MRKSEGVDKRELLSISCGSNIRNDERTAINDGRLQGKLLEANLKFLGVNDSVQRVPQIADHLSVGTGRPLPARLRQRKLLARGQRFECAARIKRKGADNFNYRSSCDFDD